MVDLLRKHRRALHRIPELEFDLPKTCAYVQEALKNCEGRVFSPCKGCVCVFFDAGKRRTAAFRADMDALPIAERGAAEYRSTHPGQMHACGHDGHTAILLGLAGLVAERPEALPRNVLLVFQPSEETIGGAQTVCGTGLLEDYAVDHIFGLHLWPGLPAGQLRARPGAMMARATEVTARFYGKSAHIARAAEGRDAMAAGMAFVQRATAMAQAQPPRQERRLLRFGRFEAGTARNALAENAVAEGSLRAFNDDLFERMRYKMEGLAQEAALEQGGTAEVEYFGSYPAVVNEPGLYRRVAAFLGQEAPALLAEPQMTAEDFAFYQQRVPGLFFLLGAGSGPALHSADFDFDESALAAGLAFFERLLVYDG